MATIPLLRYLQPEVQHILSSSATLGEIRNRVFSLVSPELVFSLALEAVLPVLLDNESPIEARLAALHVLSEQPSFRSSLEELLTGLRWEQPVNDSSMPSDEVAALIWAIWYELSDQGQRLDGMAASALIPFPLPTGSNLPRASVPAAFGKVTPSELRSAPELSLLLGLRYVASERPLRTSERTLLAKLVIPFDSLLPALVLPAEMLSLVQHNAEPALLLLKSLVSSEFTSLSFEDRRRYLLILADLPSTLPSLDFISKLLQTPESVSLPTEVPTPLADVVQQDVLGPFLGRFYEACDALDSRRKAGEPHLDEPLGRLVNITCLFLNSLYSGERALSPGDAVLVEGSAFALRFSRFSPAQALYVKLL